MLSSVYYFPLMGDACKWELGQQNPSVDTGAKDRRSLQLPEDVNGDGIVDIIDLTVVASRFGGAGENAADVNGDGAVNIQDLVIAASRFGQNSEKIRSTFHNRAGSAQNCVSPVFLIEFT